MGRDKACLNGKPCQQAAARRRFRLLSISGRRVVFERPASIADISGSSSGGANGGSQGPKSEKRKLLWLYGEAAEPGGSHKELLEAWQGKTKNYPDRAERRCTDTGSNRMRFLICGQAASPATETACSTRF